MEAKKKAAMDALFNPASVALVGASEDSSSVGYGLMVGLLKGCVFPSKTCIPFKGKIFPVNPNHAQILGRKSYASVSDIGEKVDLAVIAAPAKAVPSVMKDCARKKVKAAIIISAGFAEAGTEGKKRQAEVISIAKKAGIRVLGPNVLGVLRPPSFNASFAPSMPEPGKIAFITQSGAVADSIVDWALEARYGFSLIASLGNAADLDVSDFLEFCSGDEKTKAIALYLEGISDGKKFVEAAKKASEKKPIVVLKGGVSEKGSIAAATHTGNIAGSYTVFKAALKQAGVFSAESVEELFDLSKALSEQPRAKRNNIAIITNGGGAGVLATDYCEKYGLNAIQLKESTLKKLEATGTMHASYSRKNPLDLVGDALPERYRAALETLLAEDYIDGAIVIQTLQTMTKTVEDARVVVEAHAKFPSKPIVCVFMGGKYSAPGVDVLRKNNIPDYNDPLKAVKVMAALCGIMN